MPEIKWKYYMGRGPEADDVIAKARKAWNDVLAAREALVRDYGADGIMPGDRNKYTVTGLLYFEKPSHRYMHCVLSQRKTADGREFWKAVPNVQDAEGRILADRLASPAVTFDRKDELINILGMSCMADFVSPANRTSTSLVWSSAQVVNDIILVRMPADASKQQILGKAPKAPQYMKLIKVEEYERLFSGEPVEDPAREEAAE